MPGINRLSQAMLFLAFALAVRTAVPASGQEAAAGDNSRLRVIIETDAGGDPDDQQSLVRFLLYANEWDVEGIIANRVQARDGENENPQRTGLGIVRAMISAYGDCWQNLSLHDRAIQHPTCSSSEPSPATTT